MKRKESEFISLNGKSLYEMAGFSVNRRACVYECDYRVKLVFSYLAYSAYLFFISLCLYGLISGFLAPFYDYLSDGKMDLIPLLRGGFEAEAEIPALVLKIFLVVTGAFSLLGFIFSYTALFSWLAFLASEAAERASKRASNFIEKQKGKYCKKINEEPQ